MDFTKIPKTVSFDGERLVEIKKDLPKYPEEAQILTEKADKLLQIYY